jgi:hypothetical protein
LKAHTHPLPKPAPDALAILIAIDNRSFIYAAIHATQWVVGTVPAHKNALERVNAADATLPIP